MDISGEINSFEILSTNCLVSVGSDTNTSFLLIIGSNKNALTSYCKLGDINSKKLLNSFSKCFELEAEIIKSKILLINVGSILLLFIAVKELSN